MFQKISNFQNFQVFKFLISKFQKIFWNPRCYQHLWCLYFCSTIMPSFSKEIIRILYLRTHHYLLQRAITDWVVSLQTGKRKIGSFVNIWHGIAGEVFALDDETILIEDFTYDGQVKHRMSHNLATWDRLINFL